MNWCNDARIAWTVTFHANEGFDRRLSNDFVVVLTNPRFLACDVWSLEHAFQE